MMDSHRQGFLHFFVWFSLVFTVSPPPSERHDSDELIQYDFSFFSSIWCLPVHHFIFSRYCMWLMVILCMVASFLVFRIWVPHCKDIKRRKIVYGWLFFLFFCSLHLCYWQRATGMGWIMNNRWYFHKVGGKSRVCPHSHAQQFTYVSPLLIYCCLFFWSLFRMTVYSVWWTRRWVGLAIPRNSVVTVISWFVVCS